MHSRGGTCGRGGMQGGVMCGRGVCMVGGHA